MEYKCQHRLREVVVHLEGVFCPRGTVERLQSLPVDIPLLAAVVVEGCHCMVEADEDIHRQVVAVEVFDLRCTEDLVALTDQACSCRSEEVVFHIHYQVVDGLQVFDHQDDYVDSDDC